jgi:hypothetical protein
LRAALESWRGKPFADAELVAFDLEGLLGAACLLNIVHSNRDGSVFANVASLMKLPKNMAAPTPRDYTRMCDRPSVLADAPDGELGIVDDDIPF